MGTKYIRDTPAPTTAIVLEGSTSSFQIDKIYSEIEIGNTLDIALRRDQTTIDTVGDFVSFVEEAGSTIVHLDGALLAAGIYDVVLESYDANGSV